MSDTARPQASEPTRVPPRLVLMSIVGLWACYFLLATLRGVVLGYEFNWAFFSRRLFVSLASIAVTAAIWPLMVAMARRPVWQRAGAVMLVALPAALLLTMINGWIFADLDRQAKQRIEREDSLILRSEDGDVIEMRDGALTIRDEDGNLLIRRHGGKGPAEPATMTPAKAGFWEDNADLILGRYFMLLAWAAIYLALASAEQARAAERREGEYRQAAQAAELRSLRYQINPHFLFNTLNSLSALVLTGRGDAAERMIQMLSSYYRRSLTADPTGDLPLREEIALQRLYLDIEMQRFPDRLRAVIDVPADLGEQMAPGMILQPLIENAVKYAVAATTRPVTIRIAASREGDQLMLSVEDDGPGVAQPGIVGHGIGLANVRDRLRARFGDAASLDAGPLPAGGFRATLRLPAR